MFFIIFKITFIFIAVVKYVFSFALSNTINIFAIVLITIWIYSVSFASVITWWFARNFFSLFCELERCSTFFLCHFYSFIVSIVRFIFISYNIWKFREFYIIININQWYLTLIMILRFIYNLVFMKEKRQFIIISESNKNNEFDPLKRCNNNISKLNHKKPKINKSLQIQQFNLHFCLNPAVNYKY